MKTHSYDQAEKLIRNSTHSDRPASAMATLAVAEAINNLAMTAMKIYNAWSNQRLIDDEEF